MRRIGALLGAAGLALLTVTAATGVALAVAGLLASTGTGSRQVGGWLGGLLDGLVAGHFKLGGLWVKPGGGIEASDIEISDSTGRPVIRVALARARLDLGGLARRSVGIELELTRPEFWLEPGAEGRLTIADAFTRSGPAGRWAPAPLKADPWHGWNIWVVRLGLRDAAVSWRGQGERTWLRAGPLTIELAARIEGSHLSVPSLVLVAAASRLEAFGELDWERMSFRAAAGRVALAERDLASLAGGRLGGGDLEGRLYAESDGERLTGMVELVPPRGGGGGGRVAVAFQPGSRSPRGFGFDAVLAELDPSWLLSRAPRGRITVAARGALAWPLPAAGPFSRGHLAFERLDVRLPGLELTGAGSWREAGGLEGSLRLEASDLARAGPAISSLFGVKLPQLSGRADAGLTLAGTAAHPVATLIVRTGRGAVAGVALGEGGAEARLAGAALEFEATAGLGLLEGAAVSVRGAAQLSPGWSEALLARFELGLGGQGWTLVAPATLSFDGPRVDRAELRSGGQKLVISGGLASGGTAELWAEASGIELARLPGGLVPGSLGLAGTAGGALHLAGPAGRRGLEARVEVAGAGLRSLTGLTAKGELTWRAETGRARLAGSVRGAEAETLELAADLPWPMAGAAPGLAVSGRVAATGWRLQPLLRAAGQELPAEGRLGGELTLTGSAGAPLLQGRLALSDGRWGDLSPLDLTVVLEGPGTMMRAGAELKLASSQVARVTVELPYQRGELLAHPLQTLGQLPRAAWTATLQATGLELAPLAGKLGVPAGLSGRLSGEAKLNGTPVAPRGQASLVLAGVALAGYPALSGPVTLTLDALQTALTARLEAQGTPGLRLDLAVAAPVERLGEAEMQRLAPLAASAAIPGLELPGAPGERWSLSGRVAMTLAVAGTLAAPRATLALDAARLELGGLPLGDLKGTARTDDLATRVDLTLAPREGGTLRVDGSLGAVPGLSTPAAALAEAPLKLTVTGRDLEVGFLPALLPARIRAASGTVQAGLTVAGSPSAPRLDGRLVLAGGKLTLPGWGTFTGIGFEASLDEKTIRLRGLLIRRGSGRVEGELWLEGLGGAEARLGGSLQASEFRVAQAGMDVATIDARAAIGGRYRGGRVEVEVELEKGGMIRLPRKAPRALQPIADRPDITIGDAPIEPAGGSSPSGRPGGATPAAPALVLTFRVRGDELLLKSDQPRLNIELRTDSTWEVSASPLQVSGTLEAYLGSFEPLAGRIFKVVRGKVAFPGGVLGEAQLDLAADHENPSAKIHATVSGTLKSPNLRLISEPPLDESALAMLIVTGRTDQIVGGTRVSGLNAQDAGMAAAMAVANRVFEEQLGEKLPLDSLTLDSSAVSAAKQLTDRILISYVRRFDARPEKGQNVDEVRVQYQITPRWTLESRYGNAGAGGASIMWQRDY